MLITAKLNYLDERSDPEEMSHICINTLYEAFLPHLPLKNEKTNYIGN